MRDVTAPGMFGGGLYVCVCLNDVFYYFVIISTLYCEGMFVMRLVKCATMHVFIKINC